MLKFAIVVLMVGHVVSEPQLKDLIKQAGSAVTGLIDGCKDKESTFITKPDACALLFDHSNCRDLKRDVPQGYTSLSLLDQNDVESVLVKKGCTLILYDDNEDNVYKRGKSFGVTAYGQNNAVGKSLSGKDELEADAESVNCTCGVPVNIGKCSLPIPQGVGCILYDNPDCSVEDWSEPIFLKCGEERSFSILKDPLNIRYKNQAEALTVRKGCTLEAFDDSNFSDDQKKFEAKDADLHINLADQWRTKTTNKDIESVKCYCTAKEAEAACKA